MQLERRCGLANGRCGRFQASDPGPPGGTPGPGPILPEQAQSEKSQGVRGTDSPDSFNNTLKKTENTCPFFRGKYNPNFAAKAGHILDLYQRVWAGAPLGAGDYVICADDKTRIQARRREQPTLPRPPTRPRCR